MTNRTPVFVHAADLHLGAPLRELGKGIDDEARRELVAKVNTAFDNLIDETIAHDAEFIVLAGDIYDGAEREAHAQIKFSLGLERLVKAGIGVYIVHGNHDPLLNNVINVVSLPDGVTVFGSDGVTQVRHTLRDGRAVVVAGVSYTQVNETRNLAKLFHDVDRGDAAAVVGLLHTNLGGVSIAHGNYAPSSESDLADAPVDYWALGHVHRRQVKPIGSHRYWAYPGNLQGRDAGEEGAKGALVVPILERGVGEPQFLPLDTIRFAHLNIDCTEVENLTGIAEAIRGRAAGLSDGRPLIVRVYLRGRSEAHGAMAEVENLENALQMLCAESLHGGYIERVKSYLLPSLDVDELREADDLLGDLLRAVDSLSADDLDPSAVELDPSILTDELLNDLRSSMSADFLTSFNNQSDGEA